MRYAKRLGATWFATGHYARLVQGKAGIELHKAHDRSKDQSYFLHAVSRAQLERTLMPLGEMAKTEVRERARRAGVPVFDKPDSTGICFIGERPFRDFLGALRFRIHRAQSKPRTRCSSEPIADLPSTHSGSARVCRSADGAATRRRHGLSPPRTPRANVLVVVQGHDHPLLSSDALATGVVHWLTEAPSMAFRAQVKVRYRQADQACRVRTSG